MVMMPDDDFNRLCDEYKTMHMEWAWRLGLQWWDFRFEFYRGPIPHFGEERTADMDSKWEYQLGRTRVNIMNWQGQEPIDREETIVHELVHCILAPLRPRSESHRRRALEEHATTTLARALLGRMRPPGEHEVEVVERGLVFETPPDVFRKVEVRGIDVTEPLARLRFEWWSRRQRRWSKGANGLLADNPSPAAPHTP